jgi:hypothetical protein
VADFITWRTPGDANMKFFFLAAPTASRSTAQPDLSETSNNPQPCQLDKNRMKSRSTLLTTTAVAVWSTETIVPVTASVSPDFVDYLYEPKEIDPEHAEGGLQKLINGGVFSLEPDGSRLQQAKQKKSLPKRGRYLAHHGSSHAHTSAYV